MRVTAKLLAAAAAVLPHVPAADARPEFAVTSTAYSLCSSGTTMADGTHVRSRSVVNNTLPLGTRIRVVGRQAGPGGLRRWVVRDRIGAYSSMDFWVPTCQMAIAWGRRPVHFRLGWAR